MSFAVNCLIIGKPHQTTLSLVRSARVRPLPWDRADDEEQRVQFKERGHSQACRPHPVLHPDPAVGLR